MDIYKLWENGEKIEWINKPLSFKKAWIRTCCSWSGVQKSIHLQREYVIDGSIIKHPIDLYCLLAEALLGERGYIGSCGNSFRDCLNQLRLYESENVEKNTSRIKVIHSDKIDVLLSKGNKHEDDMSYIFEQLKECGFKIMFKRTPVR